MIKPQDIKEFHDLVTYDILEMLGTCIDASERDPDSAY